MNTKFFQTTIRKIRFPIFKIIYRFVNKDKLIQYKGKFKDKTILIVGNGPSLNITPLEEFNIPSIGMNKINLLFDKTNWRPNFIICTNGLVINQNKKFFKQTKIPVILDFKAFFQRVRATNISYFLSSMKIDFSDNFIKSIGVGGSVTYSALQFAYYLGVKKIILVGVDHSFAGKVNKAAIERFQGDDVNHFHPDYFKGQLWGIPNLEKSEVGYNKALDFFRKNEIEIYDATINGKLNIFPKIDIETAIKLSRQ